MHGQIGGSTVGIAGGGWVMFGKTPMELSVGEQAVFAAALKRNIYIRRQPDDKVRRDWAYVKERAKLGLQLAYDAADRRRIDGIAEINGMRDEPPLFFDASIPLTARAHVVHRRNITARTVVSEAQAELTDQFGLQSLAEMPLRGYELTLNSIDNFHFKQTMDQIADTLTDKLGRECRLFVPLAREGFQETAFQRLTGKPHCAPPDLPKTERAQVLAVLANKDGEILRYYQSGSEEPIYSGVIGRAALDGRYNPDAEIRDLGSVAKIAAAIVLASEGDTPTQRYCRQSFGQRLDSNGSTGFSRCDEPGAMIDAREAFARSSNLAILWRLRGVPKARLVKAATDFGLRLPGDVDPAYALAFGQVRAAPRQIHQLMHATGEIVLGHLPRKDQLIHVVHRLDAGEGYEHLVQTDILASQKLTAYLGAPDARQYVREVLGAVLTHPRGTMHFLQAFTPVANPTISAHIGKTGTPVNDNKFPTDKFVTGSLVASGQYYSYLVMVRAPNPAKYPLGQRLSLGDFAPLVTTLLTQIDGLASGSSFVKDGAVHAPVDPRHRG